MDVVEDCDDGSETGFFSLDIVCDSSPRTELVFDEDVILVKDAIERQGSGDDGFGVLLRPS